MVLVSFTSSSTIFVPFYPWRKSLKSKPSCGQTGKCQGSTGCWSWQRVSPLNSRLIAHGLQAPFGTEIPGVPCVCNKGLHSCRCALSIRHKPYRSYYTHDSLSWSLISQVASVKSLMLFLGIFCGIKYHFL